MRYPGLARRLFFFVIALVSLASVASASGVRGRVLLGAYKPTPERGPRAGFHWELDNGFKETLRDRIPAEREIAVVLTGEGEPVTTQRNAMFSGGAMLPSTLVLAPGTTLSMENRDEVAHELEAVGLEGFSAEAVAPGGTRAIHLKQAGDWPLRDRLAPHARGHLIVRADVIAIATVEANGSFMFENVPAGNYTLRVFHGASEVATQAVEVGDGDVTLDPLTPSQPAGDKKSN